MKKILFLIFFLFKSNYSFAEENIVYVERGADHPALMSEGLSCTEITLVNECYKKLFGDA